MAEFPRIEPRLIVFSDTTRAEPELMLARFAALAERAEPGRVVLTLRDYQLPIRARYQLAERLVRIAERSQQRFGLGERADLARALGCTAFHLPEAGLGASDARSYLGPTVFLSKACHDPERAPEAELDALVLSPIFEPRKGRPALGLAALERARSAHREGPALFALGAVDAHNAAACLRARAAGVALIGAALAADPEPLLAALGILRR